MRVNASSPLTHALHRWLEDGHEALKAGGTALPTGATAFLFSTPGQKQVLLGALGPSRDKVGRAFPLTVFVETELPASRLPEAPDAFAAFLSATASVLEQAERLDAATLAERLRTLPAAAETMQAQSERQSRLQQPNGGALRLLFQGRGAPDGHLYALRTLLSAAAAGRTPGAASSPTLDCPLSPQLGPWPWLELCARGGPAAPPTLLWTRERLLVAWGAPPSLMLPFLARGDHPSPKRWPLSTSHAPAVEAARKALGEPALAALGRDDSTWEQLFKAVAGPFGPA